MPSIDLPADRSAASQARRFTRSVCSGWQVAGDAIADVELMVSELVTNAVIHARSAARLTIDHLGDRIRVAVADESPAPPRLLDDGPEVVSGRGVLLVARLADGWGVEHRDATDDTRTEIPAGGKRVWFERTVNGVGEPSRSH